MSSFKEKAQIFIIGLSIGLLIAGAFFILKLDDYFKELSFYKQNSSLDESSITEKAIVSAAVVKEKKNKTGSAKTKSLFPADSTADKAKGSNVPAILDTLNVITKNDSINESFKASDDIVVRKDELLSVKTFEVYSLNPLVAKLSAKDSLLQKVSAVKDDRITGKQMFNIEFWQSPLNYKGYKMSKYKIVLYGIPFGEGLKVYKLDDVIYLKNASSIIRLDYANDFKPYERITDEGIISKLK